jgi:hypothetical protein
MDTKSTRNIKYFEIQSKYKYGTIANGLLLFI